MFRHTWATFAFGKDGSILSFQVKVFRCNYNETLFPKQTDPCDPIPYPGDSSQKVLSVEGFFLSCPKCWFPMIWLDLLLIIMVWVFYDCQFEQESIQL